MAQTPIIPLSAQERADSYPYQAPQTGFVMQGGQYRPLLPSDEARLTGRVAVLSVGSNRSPQQLLRKFGAEAELFVTPALLKDCDVIHSACFSYYGAVPCTAYPCIGTDIALNAVWLTDDQLQVMHDTEAVGIAYDYCEWHKGQIAIDIVQPPESIYGYATRLGYFSDEAGAPFALASLPAQQRRFQALSQRQARDHLRQSLPADMQKTDEASFLAALTSDKGFRLHVNQALEAYGQPIKQGPWHILPATPIDADSYL